MPEFLAVLIIVPTVAVLGMGALYIVGTIIMSVVSAVDAVIVSVRHRLHAPRKHFGTPALHH